MKPEIIKWIKIVVLRTLREKRLSHLDVDTLIAAGNLGYSQALTRFDPNRVPPVKFKTFAEYRIRGAVLDEVRKMIGDERCKNKRPNQVGDYDVTLQGDDGRAQKFNEHCLDIEKFFLEIPLEERSKLILRARLDGLNLREIGEKFGFSESRASQIFIDIKRKVYPWFREYLGQSFALVTYTCPACGHLNETAEFSAGFDCEACNADIMIVDRAPQVKPQESDPEEIEESSLA